jgi:hypothetical protein
LVGAALERACEVNGVGGLETVRAREAASVNADVDVELDLGDELVLEVASMMRSCSTVS